MPNNKRGKNNSGLETGEGKRLDQDQPAEGSDSDWKDQLDCDKNDRAKNTLQNLLIILNNDDKLQSIVFNEQADSIEIKGTVPWKHPSPYWRDADDAQLTSYLDEHYGTFSRRNYEVALAKIADDRSYHPIREYLDSLPSWDGVPRVDTVLIDYLGAEDTPYTRAVTRKTLVAAVSRIYHPGCKYDNMLVLNGPQGIGKSTLISKLGGQWFSDSLSLNDTKDKTAAEKLQGYWILEIGELAGMRKAEIETMRSFISCTNDIFRPAFGRRPKPHQRQCIFIGTTNAENGYLRDLTGNRRFLPVVTAGSKDKHPWDLCEQDVEQIWAESIVFMEKGEKLYLEDDVLAYAVSQQREALESDEREGIVRNYLQMLLPEDWDSLSTYDRTCFVNGVSTPGNRYCVGTKPRTMVSNMEIWCECFGKTGQI